MPVDTLTHTPGDSVHATTAPVDTAPAIPPPATSTAPATTAAVVTDVTADGLHPDTSGRSPVEAAAPRWIDSPSGPDGSASWIDNPADTATPHGAPVMMHATLLNLPDTMQIAAEPDSGTPIALVAPSAAGLEGIMRPDLPGYNSGILCLVLGMLLTVMFNVRNSAIFFKNLSQNLTRERKRPNVFDEHTVNETRILGALILQVCMCEAFMLLAAFTLGDFSLSPQRLIAACGALIGVTLLYYGLQCMVYNLIGYVFTTPAGSRQWIKGFHSTQAFLGFTLIVPALVALFYPSATPIMLLIGILLYVSARIVFICKGFRIFYHNFSSLLYFILYLCSVEIIPAILVYHGAFSLCRIINN